MPYPRIHSIDKGGVYHCSTIIHESRPDFSWRERSQFRRLLTQTGDLCDVEILNFAFLPRKIVLLVRVAARRPVDDEEMIRRAYLGMAVERAELLEAALEANSPRSREGRALRQRVLNRMFDLPHFMQRFNQGAAYIYNKDRKLMGNMWKRRYKSLAVMDSPEYVSSMAAAVDAQIRWEGIAEKPETYELCGFGEAVTVSGLMRQRICEFTNTPSWAAARKRYAQMVAKEEPVKRTRNMPKTKGNLKADAMVKKSLTRWKKRYPKYGTSMRPRRTPEECIELLAAYKERFGNFLVPRHFAEDTALGRWVANIRQKKEVGDISDDMLAKLAAIGFDWQRPPRGRERTRESYEYVPNRAVIDAMWQKSYEKLVAFYEENGHTRVTRAHPDSHFANWVWMQRGNLRAGKLAPERKEKLDAIKFVWEPKRTGGK